MNGGLLKFVGNKIFGHIICLLFSPYIIVNNYSELKFTYIEHL